MMDQAFESVWDALEDTPADAENMKLRSGLMIRISDAVSSWNIPATEAAGRLGVTLPCLRDLMLGRVGNFTLDTLVALAARAGLAVHIEVTAA
jgi:predicted XRE-type DNA-binding protein